MNFCVKRGEYLLGHQKIIQWTLTNICKKKQTQKQQQHRTIWESFARWASAMPSPMCTYAWHWLNSVPKSEGWRHPHKQSWSFVHNLLIEFNVTFCTSTRRVVIFSEWTLAQSGYVPSWKMLLAHVLIARLKSRTPIRFISRPVLTCGRKPKGWIRLVHYCSLPWRKGEPDHSYSNLDGVALAWLLNMAQKLLLKMHL